MGQSVSLTPKALETLIVLVESRDRVVTKKELMDQLWPDSFVEESNLSQNIFMLRKALGDNAHERRYIVTLPGRGYQFTEAVREVCEEDELTLVLERQSRSLMTVEQEEVRWQRGWLTWTIMALALASTGIAGYRYVRAHFRAEKVTTVSVPPIKVRRSVAVMGFRNLSGRPDKTWLSTALAEMVNTELASGEQLRMVSGENIANASRDLSLGESATLSKESLGRLRANLGADYVALGSYTILGDGVKSQIRLDVRLQDAVAGETIAEDAVTGTETDLFDMVSLVGSRLRERLAVERVSVEQAAQVRSSLPSNVRAARFYAEGVAKLRVFDALTARDLLTQAVAADPKSPLSYAALGAAWSALGYEVKAREATKRAVELAGPLRQEERLAIDAQYHGLNYEWPRAVELYRTLTDIYPDNIEYGLRMAEAQYFAGTLKDALATLEKYRKSPAPAGNDPRIDLMQAQIFNGLADFRAERDAGQRAVEKGKALGAPLVVAQGLRRQSWAWTRLGEFDRATTAVTEAKVLFANAGDMASSASTLRTSGTIFYDRGDYTQARRQYEEALLLSRKVGSQKSTAMTLESIGNTYYEEGHIERARSYYEQALRIERETGDKSGMCSAMGNIANALDVMGDLAGAEKMQKENVLMWAAVGDRRGEGSTEINLGNVLVERGKLDEAAKHYQRSLEINRQTGYRLGIGFALYGEADVSYEQDDLKAAREHAAQALAARADSAQQAESLMQSAILALEIGELGEAEKYAEDALHRTESAGASDTAASAYAALALTRLALGKLDEAQQAAQQAVTLAAKSGYRTARFDAALAAVSVHTAAGQIVEARKELSELLKETEKYGYVIYLYQARLLQAKLTLKADDILSAKRQFASLENDARSKGLLLVARKAAGQ
jgi:DNA-binding winged helix-turn-helix (wHTH) protein/tetratricopeptide (TPR) repeat protein